jgi:hypothetical protein
MKEQARQKHDLAQSLPQFIFWVSAGSVTWLRMFGKETPSPVQAISGRADSIGPDGTRHSRNAMAAHSSIGEVLQQVGLLVSTPFSLAWSILRSFPWNSAPPFRKVLGFAR